MTEHIDPLFALILCLILWPAWGIIRRAERIRDERDQYRTELEWITETDRVTIPYARLHGSRDTTEDAA